ncbi:MAG: hypothetical protein MSJ26_08885 [Oscillospiraceae bacterium]|nr:hypothetical protein [Oscillospiraceae bacterium]
MKMKKYLSVFAAVLIAASMAASAGAADYSSDPAYPAPPSNPTAPSGNNDSLYTPAPGKDPENPISVVDKSSVSNALRSNSPIYASYEDAGLRADGLALLANREGSVLTVETKRYTAVIRGETVTEAKDISLAIKMTKSTDRGALILRTEQQGEFGCTADIIISPKYYNQCGVDLTKAHLYFIDENKQVNDMGKIILDDDGNIVISMTVGGKYIVM